MSLWPETLTEVMALIDQEWPGFLDEETSHQFREGLQSIFPIVVTEAIFWHKQSASHPPTLSALLSACLAVVTVQARRIIARGTALESQEGFAPYGGCPHAPSHPD